MYISPSFPKRFNVIKPFVYSNFDLVGELKKLCIKILILRDIWDVSIYVKSIKELCVKNPGRKPKGSPIFHVLGTISDLILVNQIPINYDDPGNLVVNIQI